MFFFNILHDNKKPIYLYLFLKNTLQLFIFLTQIKYQKLWTSYLVYSLDYSLIYNNYKTYSYTINAKSIKFLWQNKLDYKYVKTKKKIEYNTDIFFLYIKIYDSLWFTSILEDTINVRQVDIDLMRILYQPSFSPHRRRTAIIKPKRHHKEIRLNVQSIICSTINNIVL